MPGPPNGEGRAPRQRPGPAPTTTTTAILPDQGDPRRIGELLGDWLAIRMDQVDALVDEAESKVAALPNLRNLWALFGELVVRVHFLESEVERLKGERR
jgi:hypothetical protein